MRRPPARAEVRAAYDAAAGVISAHVIAMFAPSFFTGHLIARFGLYQVMLVGAAMRARMASTAWVW
mgnify:CR=1 FL=1